ncbi:fungal-specific transcription factor domain-containing protein [Biscogniauxia mediterranea]|nr:fungal-specific transcription factor domain-containing protein [Biscogniauxia mediterranea]
MAAGLEMSPARSPEPVQQQQQQQPKASTTKTKTATSTSTNPTGITVATTNRATMKKSTPKPDEKDTPSLSSSSPSAKKRPGSGTEPNGTAKVTKRRAARACVSCRARKVRCDVVEGAPCGNCRWDNVECIVQESRRRKKNLFDSTSSVSTSKGSAPHHAEAHQHLKAKAPPSSASCSTSCSTSSANQPITIASAASGPLRRASETSQTSKATIGNDATDQTAMLQSCVEGHVPHLLYQQSGLKSDPILLSTTLQACNNGSTYASIWPNPHTHVGQSSAIAAAAAVGTATSCAGAALKTAQFLNNLEEPDTLSQLPAFIRPLPAKIAPEDVSYLHTKGALSLPNPALQNALLRAYVEYVHPYMPLIDLHDFLSAVNSRDGLYGQISLFLYQSIMFAATAYVDVKYLREVGYPNRKAARKAFFYKARLLYDFDYESDRLILVQALLLMTYWYETPDDQKDTWHWMGVAISLAHTIGLHRNPANTSISLRKQKLWKRIWWSCFMRDRLIALGMRRPTRIQDEDFDVPMLEESDFEIEAVPDEVQTVVGVECTFVRDVCIQQELALMCIAKAKLCLCISHMLKAQYSVLIRDKSRPENTTNSTMMLFPNKQLDNVEGVQHCDLELMTWVESLPPCCRYRPLSQLDVQGGRSTVAVQRNLLHMVYYTTVSALHRPQFLPSSPLHAPQTPAQVQEVSRMRVRDAAAHITCMVAELSALRLDKFLPTTGVTVILPAMIIHLLEMKNPAPRARDNAMRGFRECMCVMEHLRDIYSAADYAVAFLDAALRKAAIDLREAQSQAQMQQHRHQQQQHQQHQQQQQGYGGGSAGTTINVNKPKTAILSQYTATPGVEDMTTPPPETVPYATPQEMGNTAGGLFSTPATHPHQQQQQQQQQQFVPPANLVTHTTTAATATAMTMVGGNMAPAPAAARCRSPPHTEQEDMLTPSASGMSASSDAVTFEHLDIDLDALENQDEFDWNALTGTNIDFDQWLQFPGEGGGGGGGGGASAPPPQPLTTAGHGKGSGGGAGAGSGLVTMSEVDGSSANYGGVGGGMVEGCGA